MRFNNSQCGTCCKYNNIMCPFKNVHPFAKFCSEYQEQCYCEEKNYEEWIRVGFMPSIMNGTLVYAGPSVYVSIEKTK